LRQKALPLSLRAAPSEVADAAPRPVRPPGRRFRDLVATGIIILLIPAIIVPEADVNAGTPALTVAPAQVVAGSAVTVTGRDFVAHARLKLLLDAGIELASARTDRSGSFRVDVVVPAATSPGQHRIQVVANVSGSRNGAKARGVAVAVASVALVVLSASQSSAPSVLPTPSPTPPGSPGSSATASPTPASTSATPTPTAAPTPTARPTPIPATPTPTPAPPPPTSSQPSLPVRAAFYYPWFPEAWKQQGMDPFTKYHPSLGFYDSGAGATIRQHISAMQYGGIGVGISSWWGVGTRSDGRVPTLLANTAGSSFRWTLYYEQESQGDPSVEQLASDLRYIRDHYASDPSYFRIGGRFVVFVYTDGADACAMAARWSQANAGINAYLVLKVFSGFRTCPSQPAGWHQYAPAKAADAQAGFSYAISPAFDKANEAAPRLARDLGRWAQNVRDMIASGAPFQLVTTFNEWGEGTSVESATEWASASGYGAYLDLLHSNGN
jgi:glycosyl hydrolase family 99